MARIRHRVLEFDDVGQITIGGFMGQDDYPQGARGLSVRWDDEAPAPRPLSRQNALALDLPHRGFHSLVVDPEFRRQPAHPGHAPAPMPPLQLPAQTRGDLRGGGKDAHGMHGMSLPPKGASCRE